MNLINWLIKFLGGFTKEEHALLAKEHDYQRESGIQTRARVEFLESELKSEREERKFLQELIFKKFGIIVSNEPGEIIPDELKPISNGPTRWSNLKSRLERDDWERVRQGV